MDDKRLLKLLEREEILTKKKVKIEEELKKIAKQIKEAEHEQKVKNIEDTILILNDHGIHIKDVIKEIQKGNFDHLKKLPIYDGVKQGDTVEAKESVL